MNFEFCCGEKMSQYISTLLNAEILFFQLVYKVRLNIALENLASLSSGNSDLSLWENIVEEAKADLRKVQVITYNI